MHIIINQVERRNANLDTYKTTIIVGKLYIIQTLRRKVQDGPTLFNLQYKKRDECLSSVSFLSTKKKNYEKNDH